LAIICLNPEGPWIFQKTFAMASHPNVRAMDEWQPIYSQFAKGALITFGLCVLLILATFLATGRSFRPETWVPIVLFGIQPVLHQRTLVWFMTVTPWLMLPYYGRWLAGARPNWWSSVASFRKTLACGAIVALAITSQPIRSVNFVVNIDAPSLAPQEDPVRKPDPEQTAQWSGL
jgi:hypothetical protein